MISNKYVHIHFFNTFVWHQVSFEGLMNPSNQLIPPQCSWFYFTIVILTILESFLRVPIWQQLFTIDEDDAEDVGCKLNDCEENGGSCPVSCGDDVYCCSKDGSNSEKCPPSAIQSLVSNAGCLKLSKFWSKWAESESYFNIS